METLALLLVPVTFIGFIWLLIVGFRTSLPWGFGLLIVPLAFLLLAILFIRPDNIFSVFAITLAVYLPAIIFARKNWEEAHKAFLTYFISSFISVLISVTTLNTNNENNLELLISQVQQGIISEVDGAHQMRTIIENIEDSSSLSEQEKLVIRTAKTIITQVETNLAKDPDFYDKTINNDYQKDLAKIEAQRKKEESLKKLEERLKKRIEAEKIVQPKETKHLPIIKKSEIKKYIKAKVIITTVSNRKHQGMLKDFDEEGYNVILEKKRKTGKFIFKIHMSDIKTIHLFVDE